MPEWTAERITQAMNAGTERSVVLKQPVGIYIYYLTAWAAADNVVHYRTDIYSRDEPLLEALKKQLY
jgi:murein L,D-transpeptidase YcbB/YkuD